MPPLPERTPSAGQVEFDQPVDAKGNIEVWLQRLVDGMQGTIKAVIQKAVRNVYVSVAALPWNGVAIARLAGRAVAYLLAKCPA